MDEFFFFFFFFLRERGRGGERVLVWPVSTSRIRKNLKTDT